MCSERANLEGGYGVFQLVDRAGGASQVVNGVHWAVDMAMLTHVMISKHKTFAVTLDQISCVLVPSCEEIVYAYNLISLCQEYFA